VLVPELIEVMRNELTLLHLEDDRNAEASTKDLSRQGTDFCEAQTKTI
jgi:hypothetical protein